MQLQKTEQIVSWKEPEWLKIFREKNLVIAKEAPLQKSRYSNIAALEKTVNSALEKNKQIPFPLELEKKGVKVFSWEQALQKIEKDLKIALESEFPPKDQFEATINAFFNSGFVLVLNSGTQLDSVLHWKTTVPETVLAKTVIIIKENSENVFLLEDIIGKSARINQTIFLKPNSRVVWVRNLNLKGNSIISQQNVLQKDSQLFSANAWTKGNLVRGTVSNVLIGSGAESRQQDWCLLGKKEHLDLNLFSLHLVPFTRSRSVFKSVLENYSNSVFNGMIKIFPFAQQSNAFLEAHSLLLSQNASSNTIPCLEIEADDVKATHSASVTQVDEESLFYLQSRGINEKTAKQLIILGFLESLVLELPRDFWNPLTSLIEKKWLELHKTA